MSLIRTALPFLALPVFLLLGLCMKAQPVVAINEICAVNNSIAADPSGQFDDWVELYNNTGADIDLGEHYLSDDFANPTKWMFPSPSVIPAGGYLIVWCDNDTFQAGLHAFFKLSGAGEEVMLSDDGGNLIDSVSYGAQFGDTTFGRFPNGTGSYTMMLPTHATTNSPGLVATDGPVAQMLEVFPNPAQGRFSIQLPPGYAGELRLIHLSGREAAKRTVQGTSLLEWEATGLPAGLYHLIGPGLAPTTLHLIP
jgi:Lamin Tail Domain